MLCWQPEVNLGLIPGYGGTQRLIQFIGKGRAMELLLTGDMIDAQAALSYGLVTHVCPQEDLLALAKKLIFKLGTKGPDSIHKLLIPSMHILKIMWTDLRVKVKNSEKPSFPDESAIGVKAFFAKQKPIFKNYK